MRRSFRLVLVASLFSLAPTLWAQTAPTITLVANAEGENPVIAPNTWVEIKGSNLAKITDLASGALPTKLDGVSVTVNGKSALIYYVSPAQVDVLTPPDALSGPAQVILTLATSASAPFTVQTQPLSPSFFVFGAGPYVAAQHADYSLLGPASLSAPGYAFTPAKPGETVLLYANGFANPPGPGGTLTPLPAVQIGGIAAKVTYAGQGYAGQFQFNVVIPPNAPSGDNSLIAIYNGVETAPTSLIQVQAAQALPSAVTFYVAPSGNDFWSGQLPAPNSTNTDGPLATLDRARTLVQNIDKSQLTQVSVQFRGGTYSLPSTEMFSAADSGTAATKITYQNFGNETPVFSGGARIQNWTNVSGNTWKTTLPATTQLSETLFYNGARRLRPRLGGYLGTYYRSVATIYLNAPAPPAKAPDPNCSVYVNGSGWECFDRFQYDPADPISKTWKNLAPAAGNPCGQPSGNAAITGDIELLDWEQFTTSKLRISCIDTAAHIVYLTGPTGISQTNYTQQGFIAGNRYLIENVQDQLLSPGQWFLDHSTTPWTLTYLANPGENPNTDTVILPQLSQLIIASNLQYVTFQGLTFEHDNYTLSAAGYSSHELEPDVTGALSFQNSSRLTFDGITVTQISGTGLEIIPCLGGGESPAWCVANDPNGVTANNVIENSSFYDLGALGIRIGEPRLPVENDANSPQFFVVQNNVVEGYGRTFPAAFGIGQGAGHDNLYTHNDVYEGYHTALSISDAGSDTVAPTGKGNFNNTIAFNHVWNLFGGIMNDGGSIRIEAGNQVYTAPGNKILNNKIHDVTDASIMDSNGYGGHGIYLDNQTGLVDVENNLVYRVSGFGVEMPQGPANPNQPNIIKNNILAFARQAMMNVNSPYQQGVKSNAVQVFTATNNLMYFDRSLASTPNFMVQGGCLYGGGYAYTQYQLWNSNMYWRTDGAFAGDPKTFAVQPTAIAGNAPSAPCSPKPSNWTFYSFAQWQQTQKEDLQSVIQNPGFANPAYPADDYTLKSSPGVGFVPFDPSQAGRTNPVLKPPAVPPGFPTKTYSPMSDY